MNYNNSIGSYHVDLSLVITLPSVDDPEINGEIENAVIEYFIFRILKNIGVRMSHTQHMRIPIIHREIPNRYINYVKRVFDGYMRGVIEEVLGDEAKWYSLSHHSVERDVAGNMVVRLYLR